jgi:hypothetical protein
LNAVETTHFSGLNLPFNFFAHYMPDTYAHPSRMTGFPIIIRFRITRCSC